MDPVTEARKIAFDQIGEGEKTLLVSGFPQPILALQIALGLSPPRGARYEPRRRMAEQTSYEPDIRPLFTERDRKAFDLASYDDVKTLSAAIYDRIRGISGAVMPPPPPRGDGPWPQRASISSANG